MRNTIAKLLTVAASMLFVVALAACNSETKADQPSYTGITPLNPETATLEQVLERTRLTMADIVTYKTRGTNAEIDSTGESTVSSLHSAEFHSYDRYRFKYGPPEYRGSVFTEWLAVGPRIFSRNSSPEWQEEKPSSGPVTPTPPSQGFLSFLYEDDIELISTDALTSDGRSAYRIGFVKNFNPPYSESNIFDNNRQFLVHNYTDSYLIDAESFLIVSRATIKLYKSNFFDESSSEPGDNIEWVETTSTTDYYDYNEPVVIDVPGEYVLWSGDVVLSSVPSPDTSPAQ